MEISRMVVNRQKSAAKVIASARTHKSIAGAGMAALLGSDFGIAAEQLMSASADRLENATGSMVAADEAHIAEIGDDAAQRSARDESAHRMRGVLIDFRDLTTTMFGAQYVGTLGYEGDTPDDPVMLQRLGKRILERIDGTDRPGPRFEGMTFDPEPWKKKIQESLAGLGEVLENIATEEREAEQTLTAKRQAIEKYDEVLSKTASLVSAMLRIAGEDELADRVRPVKSRPGQISDPDVPVDSNQ